MSLSAQKTLIDESQVACSPVLEPVGHTLYFIITGEDQ